MSIFIELLSCEFILSHHSVFHFFQQSGFEDIGLISFFSEKVGGMNLVHDHVINLLSDTWVVIKPSDIVFLSLTFRFIDHSVDIHTCT